MKTPDITVHGSCQMSMVEVRIKGYGDKLSKDGNGSPVALEMHDGKMMLYIWSDINQEDPTHKICLDGAKETCRRETGTCIHCGESISIAPDGCWVHDTPDEDPSNEDYGWAKCSGETTAASPKEVDISTEA